jgi:hypothetical protein
VKLRLFRGITVPAVEALSVIEGIKAMGLRASNGRWKLPFPRPRDEIQGRSDEQQGYVAPNLEDEPLSVCACGDEASAAYYAWDHNRSGNRDTPIMIEFEVEEARIAVDGRDLLYTVFGNGDPDRARPALQKCFGDAVLSYVDRAWATLELNARFALCDRAVLDRKVVRAHYSSTTVIAGRFNTVFKSAFQVKLPVEPGQIVRVWAPSECVHQDVPTVHFTDLLYPTWSASG